MLVCLMSVTLEPKEVTPPNARRRSIPATATLERTGVEQLLQGLRKVGLKDFTDSCE
jgi:hypothetical protein